MGSIVDQCIESYQRHKHLKLVGNEVGIPWQTVYVHLRNAGVPVVGDKLKYGTESDKLAAKAEAAFYSLVPFSIDQNQKKYQSKVDFVVRGYSVDVKSSTEKRPNKNSKTTRWAFCLKKQELLADFFVCFAYETTDSEIKHCFLIPGEIARNYTTMSISSSTKGKWWDYEILPNDLELFFQGLPEKQR